MRPLIINELRQYRLTMLVVTLITLATALVLTAIEDQDLAIGYRFIITLVPAYFGLTLPAMSFRNENRGGTWRFLRALPASGSIVVSAKAGAALLVLGAGSVVALAGLMIANGGSTIQATRTLSLPVVFGLGLLGLNFGLCFRFGERHASLALLVILATLQITGMVQFALAPGGGIRDLITAVEQWFEWAQTPMGLLICSCVAVVALAAGWILSIRIYDARDITHPM